VVAVFRVWWRPQPRPRVPARHPPGESAFRVRRPRRGHAGVPPPRVASTASTPPPVPARWGCFPRAAASTPAPVPARWP